MIIFYEKFRSSFGCCLTLAVLHLLVFVQTFISVKALSMWAPEILFENDRLFIINKPSGIGYHNDLNNSDDSVDKNEDGILTLIRKAQVEGRIRYDGRLCGVHRLDKVTSGILVFAKDNVSAGLVSKAFREKTATKYYFALSAKRPKKRKQGLVKGDMIKARRGAWQLKKTADNPALTKFYTCGVGELNEQFLSNGPENTLARTAILFQPITGRTHQLRVASKSEGMPILGDILYSGLHIDKFCERTYLHSTALHLEVEGGIGTVTVASPPPFSDLWKTQPSNSLEADAAFKTLYVSMMKKYCSRSEILELSDFA